MVTKKLGVPLSALHLDAEAQIELFLSAASISAMPSVNQSKSLTQT
jgi:hypothetical protein